MGEGLGGKLVKVRRVFDGVERIIGVREGD